MKYLIGCMAALGLATGATAQQAGSTYPEGSNLPQRTGGEVGTKPAGPMSGSAGPSTTHHQRKKMSGKKTNKQRNAKSKPSRAPFHP